MMLRYPVIIGSRFGNLAILSYEGSGKVRCLCDCGNYTTVAHRHLRYGFTKSCGCLMYQAVHGDARGKNTAPEYKVWVSMRHRCQKPRNRAFKFYGGRGIRVCERWDNYQNFLADMGRRPSPQHSIDRINTNGGYEPSNCRWATRQEQQNNMRSNHLITYAEMTKTISQWARYIGVNANTLSWFFLRGGTLDQFVDVQLRRLSKS